MTSKISYAKYILEDIKRRGWLFALSAVTFLTALPIYTVIWIDTCRRNQYAVETMIYRVPGLFNGEKNFLLLAALALLPVLIAMTGFGYIHSKEKLDFYHALPLKREQLFLISYVSGLLIFLVTYFVSALLAFAVLCANGLVSPGTATHCGFTVLCAFLCFFLVYHTVILGIVLTGQHVTALLGAAVISIYPLLVSRLLPSLESFFFKTYYPTDATLFEAAGEHFSSAVLFIASAFTIHPGDADLSLTIADLIYCVLTLVLSVFLYRIYRSETAEGALAFPKTAPVFKVLICIPAALFLGLFSTFFTGNDNSMLVIFISIFSGILLCGIIELIYTRDIRMILKSWKSSLISVGGVLVVLAILAFDLTGYDRYLPKKDRIESIRLCPATFNSYFSYPKKDGMFAYDVALEFAVPDEYEREVYLLAQEGIKNMTDGITPDPQDTAELSDALSVTDISRAADDDSYTTTAFCYELNGGKKVYRSYKLSTQSLIRIFQMIGESEDYKRELFPVFHVKHSDVYRVDLEAYYGSSPGALDLSREQIDTLLSCYEKDVLETDISVFSESFDIIGTLSLTLPNDVSDLENTSVTFDYFAGGNSYSLWGLRIYPEFKHTISCLKEFGYPIDTKISISENEIARIVLNFTSESVEYNHELFSILPSLRNRDDLEVAVNNCEEFYIEDPDEISIVLDYLIPSDNTMLKQRTYFGYATINPKDSASAYLHCGYSLSDHPKN